MQGRFISYLDLMCCGFGGALLMFLIVASANERLVPAQPMLVVRCRTSIASGEGPQSNGAELGIEYRRVGARDWTRVNGPPTDNDLVDMSAKGKEKGEKWSFQPPTAPGQPAESVAIFRYPQPGKWEFRAYLADFPSASNANTPLAVEFEILGSAQAQSKPKVLLTPGTTTSPIPITIGAGK
jgi:hypothetical protein